MPTWTKEQTSAIELDGTNIIVSAGAGSGKTAVLSERVIHKLKSGIHIDELLLLTFTRFSAEEMKDRIRKKIKKDPKLKNELDAIDSAYITTFDSFALSVVKKYHYLLNLPPNIAISDDSVVALEKKNIMDKVFDEFYEKNDSEFTDLIKRFCLKNDKSLRSSILNLAEKIEGYIDKDHYIDFIKNEFFTKKYLTNITDEYQSLVKEKQNILSLELQNAYHYFDEDYITKLETSILPIINTDSIEKIRELKSTRLPNLPRGTDDEAKQVKEDVKNALKNLMDLVEFGDSKQVIDDIMTTKNTSLTIISIIEEFFQKLKDFKTANQIYTFSDIAELAIRILKEHESARLELKNKFKEIMIDEYQDTNDVQETFINLIARDNVYMVGDIKQSIYRFRGSNPSIFKDKYDNYSHESGGKKIDLIKNFRSRSEVLNNINRIFDLIMDDDLGGAAYTVSHEMVFGNETYTSLKDETFNYDFDVLEYPSDDTKEFSNSEIEIFTIAKDIKNKMDSSLKVFDKDTGVMRDFRYSDAVIILDRSKYFDDFKTIFEYLGIPLTILKDDKLNSSMDIYLIKNIIELLIKIHDQKFDIDFRYAFLSVGRSFLYEYTDDELFTYLTEETYKDSKLFQDFSHIEDFNSMTIKDFLIYILNTADFYKKLNKVGDYDNTNVRINKLIEISTNLASLGYTILDFKDYLNNIIDSNFEIKYTAAKENADSVKILTIHKSKGLEYPICYFADLDHKFNTGELKEKFISDHHYGLITPLETESLKDDDTLTKVLYKNTFLKEEIGEKIRLFYVALTRAREKIIICLPNKETRKLEKNEIGTIELSRRLKFNKLSDFIYGIKDYLPEYFKKVDINEINLSKNYLYSKSIDSKVESKEVEQFEVQEISIEQEIVEAKRFSKNVPELITEETRKNMEYGTKVHEILELIDFNSFNPNSIEDEFIRNKVTKFINCDLLKNKNDAKIYHEYEFVYEKDFDILHGSIDLMLEYADHIDIIDYKLMNTTDEHYLDQLHGYQDYINSISNKPTNIYLYSIIKESITKLD